jgi:hypothetical protein
MAMGLCLEAAFKPLWMTNGTTEAQAASQVPAQVIVTLRSYAIALHGSPFEPRSLTPRSFPFSGK